jgi:hypothetical protein
VSIQERNRRRAPRSGELRLHAFAPAIGECRERAERAIEQCLEPLANQPREHRRRSAGRHRDLHRRAIDDRGMMKLDSSRSSDHVAGNARGAGGRRDLCVHRAIVGGGHHQPHAVDIRRGEGRAW